MSDSLPAPPLTPAAPAPAPDDGRRWQALPRRARPLFLVSSTLPMAIAFAVLGGVVVPVLSRLLPPQYELGLAGTLLGGLAGLACGAAYGMWLGAKRYRYTLFLHDEEGLAVRRGKLWQRETRVPASRVQHLDIKRGPWQRRRNLSTLTVHTAGTRHSAVEVPHMDADDAERLRERLARQIDHDLDHDPDSSRDGD